MKDFLTHVINIPIWVYLLSGVVLYFTGYFSNELDNKR